MEQQREPIPGWARAFLALVDKLIWNAPGKPRIRVAWAVDFHKIFTLFIIYAMMNYYDNFTTTAWVYLGLHGIYGYCWLIKDFEDRQSKVQAIHDNAVSVVDGAEGSNPAKVDVVDTIQRAKEVMQNLLKTMNGWARAKTLA